MENKFLLSAPFYAGYGRASGEPVLLASGSNSNDNTDIVPERWAAESLMILEENMVMPQLVNRNYDAMFQKYGDVVNIDKPREMTGRRKVDGEAIVKSPAITDNIPIKLDQHLYEAFHVYDGELSLAFEDLVTKYIEPASLALGRMADKIVSAQFAQFMWVANAGHLGVATVKNDLLDLRNAMNKQNAHVEGRRLVLTPDTETDLLKLDAFTEVDKVGTTAGLVNAALGRKFNFDIFMGQQQPQVLTGTTQEVTTVYSDAARGATVVTVATEPGQTLADGQFITFEGDDIPHLINSSDESGNITIYPALKRAIVNGAAVVSYIADTVDQTATTVAAGGTTTVAGYRKGWHKGVATTGSDVPDVGTLVVFGTAGDGTDPVYVVIDVQDGEMWLDRPLEVAVADNAAVNYGPTGSYNFGFHQNALTFVSRPLQPAKGGPITATMAYGGLALRITISYDGDYQRHLVVLDSLCGVSILETGLGAVLFGA